MASQPQVTPVAIRKRRTAPTGPANTAAERPTAASLSVENSTRFAPTAVTSSSATTAAARRGIETGRGEPDATQGAVSSSAAASTIASTSTCRTVTTTKNNRTRTRMTRMAPTARAARRGTAPA